MSPLVRRRLWMLGGLVAIAGALGLLVAGGLEGNLVYFHTPSELAAKGTSVAGVPLRLGGRVVPGSVEWEAETRRLEFMVADSTVRIPVRVTGAPPAMFQEGIGVVVEGSYNPDGTFDATNVMVKHSNEYRPPEEGEMPAEMYRSLIREDAR